MPWDLGEGVALRIRSTLHLPEVIFLRVCAIPDPVHKEVGYEECRKCRGTPLVNRGSVVGKVDRTVAIAEWHAGEVPEDQHEAPFLVVHIPSHW